METIKELKIKKERLMKVRPLTQDELKIKTKIEVLNQVLGLINEIERKLENDDFKINILDELKSKITGESESINSTPEVFCECEHHIYSHLPEPGNGCRKCNCQEFKAKEKREKEGCGKEFDFKYKGDWIKLKCGIWKSMSPVDSKMEYCGECE